MTQNKCHNSLVSGDSRGCPPDLHGFCTRLCACGCIHTQLTSHFIDTHQLCGRTCSGRCARQGPGAWDFQSNKNTRTQSSPVASQSLNFWDILFVFRSNKLLIKLLIRLLFSHSLSLLSPPNHLHESLINKKAPYSCRQSKEQNSELFS